MKKKFVLLGGAGFVAPRHYKAIKEIDGDLIAIMDPHDSVGVIDSYFPDCKLFTEFERFDRFCSDEQIDYVSICSPNYLHDSHCMFALRLGADAICEKPLVLNCSNITKLQRVEVKSKNRIWCILQLRLHPILQQLKEYVQGKSGKASLEYQTPRGDWYPYSWKGATEKSGGLATNIGVHLFDLLLLLFGADYEICYWNGMDDRKMWGDFKFGNYEVSISLGITKGVEPQRLFTVDGDSYDISGGFKDAHTKSYQGIMDGVGFGIEDTIPAIQLCSQLRSIGLWKKEDSRK